MTAATASVSSVPGGGGGELDDSVRENVHICTQSLGHGRQMQTQ